jgi:CubicO group peptidase (beta-lactamase class C family)
MRTHTRHAISKLWQAISNGKLDLIQLYGPIINTVTIRQLLQMTAGIEEYDSAQVRRYQNAHRLEDLSPLWVLKWVQNNTKLQKLRCKPGTCGVYSSTNYVLLGLVLARYQGAANWDVLDQRQWTEQVPRQMPEVQPGGSFDGMYYGMHGPYSGFTTAAASQGTHSTVHGYQPALRDSKCTTFSGCAALDVFDISATGGWTCGNLVSTPTSAADFFWALLGPERTKYALLNDKSYAEFLAWKKYAYFSDYGMPAFGYGLGVMDFTSMDWGFQSHGTYYGHSGVTYGFGSQSGVNLKYNFSASWISAAEVWMGPDPNSGQSVYIALVNAIDKFHRYQKEQHDRAFHASDIDKIFQDIDSGQEPVYPEDP